MIATSAVIGTAEAVILDMDGVVTDTASVHEAAWTELFDGYLAEHGQAQRPFDSDDYRRHVDGRARVDGVVGFLRSRGIELPLGGPADGPTADTAWGLANRKNSLFLDTLERSGIRAFPGSVAFLHELRARDRRTGVVTASRNADRILVAAGVGDLFDVQVDGTVAEAEGLAGKPDPATFLAAARRLDADPVRSVVIEDAIAGVEAGRRGGFGLVVGVDRVGQAAALLTAGADVVVADLEELSLEQRLAAGRLMLKREILPPPEHLFPPDEWRIVEARWSPEYWQRAESIFALSNGYVGMRGTYDEGRPAFAPGGYITGFYESWPITYAEDAYGLARVGQTIVNLADATALELFVDDEPLFLPTARLIEYARILDMRDGTVTRDLVWATAAGKNVRVRSRRLVSLEHRHLAAVSFEVTLDHAAPVAIRSRISSRVPVSIREATPGETPDPRLGRKLDGHVLEGVTAEGTEGRFMLAYRTRNSGMTLAIGAEHVIESDAPTRLVPTYGPDEAEATITVDAEAGTPVRIVKYLAFHTSRVAPPADLVARCERTVDRAVRDGFDAHVAAQRSNLDEFWERADVVVESTFDPVRVQQAVRWNLFQLAQASWRAEGTGIPAKGLTGGAYDGHYFWDTEIYIVAFLSYTHPRIARNLLRFRHSMLPAARERAEALGHRGATFPWRTINGQEASPQFQSGTAEYHLNADIAYAIRRYVDVLGDVDFLVEVGAELLVESARMWEALGFYDADGVFHLHGVTGPDEYTTVVNDNAFTNLMARLNLNYAVAALQRLEVERPEAHAALCLELGVDPSEPDAWTRAACAMHIPHDPVRDITPQDDTFLSREPWDLDRTPPDKFPLLLHYHPLAIYRHQVLKQADVVMAMFLLGNEFTLEQKRRNFEYYDPLTTGDSSLSASIQSIVAAEIGNYRAATRYFDFALLMDLADVAGNVSDGVHVASSAGVWMALVFGFGGIRDYDGALSIDPRLPHRWRSLSIPIRFQDRQLRITLTHDEERYALEDGAPLELSVRGQSRTLTVDEPLVLAAGSRP